MDELLQLQNNERVIYLAGGCFWGVEKLCSMINGVVSATSGYANGTVANPTYQQVKAQITGARETVRVVYDPEKVNLESILYAYFYVVDPTVTNQQGHDIGTQYQAGIYYTDEVSEKIVKVLAERQKQKTEVFCIEIKALENFYEAEEYHQKYLVKNPDGYCHINPIDMKKAIVYQPSLTEDELK